MMTTLLRTIADAFGDPVSEMSITTNPSSRSDPIPASNVGCSYYTFNNVTFSGGISFLPTPAQNVTPPVNVAVQNVPPY